MTTPKMRAYASLVAAAKVSLHKKFKEENVKRDSSGKFAKKAGTKAAAPAPAKKATAAAPPKPGKKMTNKIVYGKHANGTIIETSDGQHRMIFNASGNNWTFQERTPDGGWTTTDVLGKGAAYKKSQSLSSEWGDPHDGTPAELTPVPPSPSASPITNSFAPGWDDLSGANISSFQQLQINTAFATQNPSPGMSPAVLAQNVANIAQTHNVEPEQVVALADLANGNTAFSDALKKHLGGASFPPPIYPSAAKKAAAMKKATTKKTAASFAPTVTPAPTPPAPTSGMPAAPPPLTATTNPFALAQAGQSFETAALAEQAHDSAEVEKLRQELMAASAAGASFDEITKLSQKYVAARQKYTDKWAVSWNENHGKAVASAYAGAVASASASTAPTPIPGASAGVKTGAVVQTLTGALGTVIGPVTMPSGQPGVTIKLHDGTLTNVNLSAVKKASPAAEQGLADAPPNGEQFDTSVHGTVTVVGTPTVSATGEVVVSVLKSDGTTTKMLVKDLKKAASGPAPATPAGLGVGTVVTTPNGPGTITDVSPSGKKFQVTHPDGKKSIVDAADVSEVPPSNVPVAPAPTASASTLTLVSGTHVSTPNGNGTVVGTMTLPNGMELYQVRLAGGNDQVNVLAANVSEITPTAPPPPPPAPTSNPGATYDAAGVPVLSLAQQHTLQSQFQNAGVAWYNSSETLFDAAHAASQATGLSIEDVLKYADANFHNSSKDGGKPIQTKVAKWAKSSKGKAHIQAKLGTTAAAPVTPAPPAATGPADISGVPKLKQNQAYTQFTAGFVSLNDTPQSLAQKAADVAKNTGLTPEQVLAIVDQKKADAAGVPNGGLFTNKVQGHLAGKSFPTPTPAPAKKAAAKKTAAAPLAPLTSGPVTGTTATTAFPQSPGFMTLNAAGASQMQANMQIASPPPWNTSQRASLRNYTGSNYSNINRCLRFGTGCTPSVKKHIANATAGMRPTTENITTFRGTSLAAFGVSSPSELENLVGQTVHEPGFSSTSIQMGSAFSGSIAMQIEVPAGTPGAYVGNISQYPHEQEFILPPGTRFRVLEVKPSGGKTFIRVEVVPA